MSLSFDHTVFDAKPHRYFMRLAAKSLALTVQDQIHQARAEAVFMGKGNDALSLAVEDRFRLIWRERWPAVGQHLIHALALRHVFISVLLFARLFGESTTIERSDSNFLAER